MTKSKQHSIQNYFKAKPYDESVSKSIEKRKPLRSKDQNTPTKTVKSKTFIDLTVSSPIVPVSTFLSVSTTFPSSGLLSQDSGRSKSDLPPLDRPLNTVNEFFFKKQTTFFAAAMTASHSNDDCDENANLFIGSNSIQALKNDPETSAPSLKRKAAAIVVSDDEEDSPVASTSNSTAKSLPEVLLSLKMTKDRKVAIPASVWARVQKDDFITVRQYNRASPGGYREVEKTATRLADSGITKDGIGRLTPISSFMVKSFKAGVLLLSGYSVAIATNVKDNSDPKVSLSMGVITLYYLERLLTL